MTEALLALILLGVMLIHGELRRARLVREEAERKRWRKGLRI